MSKKTEKKLLSQFDTIADSKEDTNVNVNDNVNDNIEIDEVDRVIQNRKMKMAEKSTKPKGIYFEVEVSEAIDRITEGKGRGAKSDIVNAAVKQVFKEKGWL